MVLAALAVASPRKPPLRLKRNATSNTHVEEARPACSQQDPSSLRTYRSKDFAVTVIPPQTPLTERENARTPIEQVPVGKNQKAAIVDHQLQAGIVLAQAPTDPAIARGALQCRGRKAQQRDPLLPPACHIPQRLADLRQIAQVVMLAHELLVAGLLAGTNQPDHHLAKLRRRSSVNALRMHSGARIPGRGRDVQKNL